MDFKLEFKNIKSKLNDIKRIKKSIQEDLKNNIKESFKSVLKEIDYLQGITLTIHNQYNDEGYDNQIRDLELIIKRKPLHPELLEKAINKKLKNLTKKLQESKDKNYTSDAKYYEKKLEELSDPENHFYDIIESLNDYCEPEYNNFYKITLFNTNYSKQEHLDGLILETIDLQLLNNFSEMISSLEDDILNLVDLDEDESIEIVALRKDISKDE